MLMMDHPFTRALYLALAAFAGSITALALRPYKDLNRIEIAFSIFVGFSFSIFVGPWILVQMYGAGPVDHQIAGGVLYISAIGSHGLIPVAVKKLTDFFGGKEPKEET